MPGVSIGAARLPAIHQFHGSSSVGDAITNGMFYIRRLLQGFGVPSEIYCEDVEPRLASAIRPAAMFPDDAETVLLLHYSWAIRSLDWLRTLKCRKVLVFHNITPPEFFEPESPFARLSAVAHVQLRELRGMVDACLTPSAYNARQLERLGFRGIEILPLLFDLEAWRGACKTQTTVLAPDDCFHVLFVGRIVEHKRQEDLLFVLARLRELLHRPVRLTLVGGTSGGDGYLNRLKQVAAELAVEPLVTFANKLGDADLHGLYHSADVFLCLSEHEGFCVPLLEATASDLPVVAYGGSAIAETLGGAGLVLDDKEPSYVAAVLKVLAEEPDLRRALVAAGRNNLKRFAGDRVRQSLARFLNSRFGWTIPEVATSCIENRPVWRIEGPFDSSYSLALVNRSLAQALQKAGIDVGLFSTEGPGDFEPDEGFLAKAPEIRALWQRGSAGDNPDVVLRNLYPPRVSGMNAPTRLLASWGWEESGIPAEWIDRFNRELNLITVFSRFVAKALIDNGLRIPVAVVGNGAEHFGKSNRPTARPANSRFTFLSISSGFPRKGIDVLLQAWARAFTRADGVRLVIKTFPNPHNDVAEQIEELRLKVSDLAEIEHIDTDLEREQLASLYEECDAVVMPSRGEGFGLPAIEAMIREIPVIATGHGGMADFCSEATAWLVDYRFARARSHFDLFDSVWAEPDVESLAGSLRTVRHAPPSVRRLRTTAARRQVDAVFSWQAVAERTTRALAWLESRPSSELLPRAAWVTSWNARCGIAAYARHLACAVPSSQLQVFASRTGEPLEEDEIFVQRCWEQGQDDPLDELYAAIMRSGATSAVLQFNFGFYNLKSFGRLIDRLSASGVDCHVVLHSTLDVDWPDRHLSLRKIRDSLSRARRLLVHGVADLNVLKAFGLVDNVVLLPHGAAVPPPLDMDSCKAALGLAGKRVIVSFGYALPHKGLEQLLVAFFQLQLRHPDLHLLMCNSFYPAPESDQVVRACRSLIEKNGTPSSVTLRTEHLPEGQVHAHLSAADLIVFPYQATQESASGAIRFALASRRPVAITPLSIFDDVEDVVQRLPGCTTEQIAAGLSGLLENSDLLQAQQARQEMWLEAHDWRSISRRLWNMVRAMPPLDLVSSDMAHVSS